ncbi:MAG: AAA family ATPase [Nocardioides sp.]
MEPNTSPLIVGLIGMPDLGEACPRHGIRPVTGEDYRSAATGVREHMDSSGPIPILIAGTPWPGMRPWLERASRETRIALLVGADTNRSDFPRVTSVELPATLAEIFAAIGLTVPSGSDGLVLNDHYEFGETPFAERAAADDIFNEPDPVGEETGQADAAGDDPWGDKPLLVARSEPIEPETHDDLWGNDPFAAVVEPEPAAEEDPWGAPPVVAAARESESSPIEPRPDAPVVQIPRPSAVTGTRTFRPHAARPGANPWLIQRAGEPEAAPVVDRAGHVVVVWSSKGGAGKTTTSAGLAQRAGMAGVRTILVDSSVGQGDIRTFLRVGTCGGDRALPSVYQAAIADPVDIRKGLIDPEALNASRPKRLERLEFTLLTAPPPSLADPKVVTPELYRELILQAAKMADLVVVDTQILEATDFSGVVTGLIYPLMTTGAWSIGVTDASAPSAANMIDQLARQPGIQSRKLTMMNRIPADAEIDRPYTAANFNRRSVFLGFAAYDPAITNAMNFGKTVATMPAMAPLLDAALARITSRSSLRQSSPAKRSWLSRLGLR